MSSCVTAVPVLPVSCLNVSVFGEVVLSDSDCGFVESETFPLSRECEARLLARQEDMSIGGTPEKTLPVSNKKI